MHVPEVLLSLADQGIIDEVIRPLKSGKEAQVYLVMADGEARVAKVYKDAQNRSFKQRAQYMEGRRVRNTRDQRAIANHTRHGKAQEEEAWKSAEVNIIYRLHAQGVRVPIPYNFIDGVLIMELVRGEDGHPAPRLSELSLDAKTARSTFDQLLSEVVKMLCAGVVHGDLSDYNVLIDPAGPVIIDFPQSVDASANRNARTLLLRDVDNLSAFLARCVPGARRRPYGQEIWAAYESNLLTPDSKLTGQVRRAERSTNMGALLDEIEAADSDERRRRDASGETGPRPRKREVVIAKPHGNNDREGGRRRHGSPGASGRAAPGQSPQRRGDAGRAGPNESAGRSDGRRPTESGAADRAGTTHAPDGERAPKRRRRRRRGGGPEKNVESGQTPARNEGSVRAAAASPSAASSGTEATSGAPKTKRRRRRRRQKEQDPAAAASADRPERTRTDGAD